MRGRFVEQHQVGRSGPCRPPSGVIEGAEESGQGEPSTLSGAELVDETIENPRAGAAGLRAPEGVRLVGLVRLEQADGVEGGHLRARAAGPKRGQLLLHGLGGELGVLADPPHLFRWRHHEWALRGDGLGPQPPAEQVQQRRLSRTRCPAEHAHLLRSQPHIGASHRGGLPPVPHVHPPHVDDDVRVLREGSQLLGPRRCRSVAVSIR